MRFTIRDLLWLMVVVGLGVTLLVQGIALRVANVAANDAYQRTEFLLSSMRKDGYEIDAPNGARGPIRIPSTNEILAKREAGQILPPNSH